MTFLAWALLAYGAAMTLLFVIVDASHAETRRELDELRRRHHPATRNRKDSHR